MLHGKAVIDLYNMKTHRSERIQHTNMLTNWTKDSFVLPSVYLNRPNYGLSRENIFGGLMMFAQPLSNDATEYRFPNPSNRMVAHADRSTYNGTDLSRGSFNSAISSSVPGTITNVWDFVQEQGNGTISSLGLCNPDFAKVGSGQDTPPESNTTGKLASFTRDAMVNPNITGNHIFDGTNNKIYVYSVSGGVVTITEKIGIGFGSYNPVDGTMPSTVGQTYISENNLDNNRIATRTVDLSSVLGNVSNVGVSKDDDTHIYIIALGSDWASGARTLVRLDLTDGTYTTQTITNNTGKTISAKLNTYLGSIAVFGGYFYASSGVNVVYIKLTDNSDCGTVVLANGTALSISGTIAGIAPFSIVGDSLFVFDSQSAASSSTTYTANCFTVYEGLALYVNLAYWNYITSGGWAVFQNISKAWGALEVQTRSSNIVSNMIPCLSTKNNLEAAVTKTADMTMRVTYTVTDQAE